MRAREVQFAGRGSRRIGSFIGTPLRQLVAEAGVEVIEGEAIALRLAAGSVQGVELADGASLQSLSVILTTGTFLGAMMFRGEERWAGGRFGGQAAGLLGRTGSRARPG